jgi:hypothetical protein
MGGLYDYLVFAHLLAFVFWLGADLGVAILGAAFRDRTKPLETRLELLRLLTVVDMGPRTAWVVMVPLSLALVQAGGYWDVPLALTAVVWLVAAAWMALVWRAHLVGPGAQSARLKQAEFWLKVAITLFYAWLGLSSVLGFGPLAGEAWLAWKAVVFAAIFVAAIMIDVAFKPVGPLLGSLIQQGSSDATELPLRQAMDSTRLWVWLVYALLVVVAWLGSVKPF